MNPSYLKKIQEAQTWWKTHQDVKSLQEDLHKCLDSNFAFSDNKVPLVIRRIVHFDTETRQWITNNKLVDERLLSLDTLSVKECDQLSIPVLLQHTLNNEWKVLFEQAKQICDAKVDQKKQDFKKLQDRIDTSQIRLTDEIFEKKAREHLPTGTNAVATKKYLDWIQEKKDRYADYANHSRSFWTRYKDMDDVWETLWNNPLTVEIKKIKHIVPADLTSYLLHAKLNGAIQIFPKSGLYVGEWSIQTKSKENDWQLGLFTLFPRYAHEYMLAWKGNITMDAKEEDEKKSHYRQSVPYMDKTFYVEVVDADGREMNFTRTDEWIAQYSNEPPPKNMNNALTVVGIHDPKNYKVPKGLKGIAIPSVEILTVKEVQANEEIFFKYYTTETKNKERIKSPYPTGESFEDTRRRMYFFLPGQPLRNWIEKPIHQKWFAEYLSKRLFQMYIDDFYWRHFQVPSLYSHLWKDN